MRKGWWVLTLMVAAMGIAAGYGSHMQAGFLRPLFQQDPEPENCHLRHTRIGITVPQREGETIALSTFSCEGPCKDPNEPPCKREPANVPQEGEVADIHCKCKDKVLRDTECQMTGAFGRGRGTARAPSFKCSQVGCKEGERCALGTREESHADPDSGVTVKIVKTFCFCKKV